MEFNQQYDETVSVGEWIGSIILCAIPIVNIVMVFVWAFGGATKPSKRNFFRAYLLLTVIGISLTVLGFVALSSMKIFDFGAFFKLLGF